MTFSRIIPVLACGIAFTLQAGGWAPIPPEVWAMKEDPARGEVGAVILEQRICFTGTAIKHVLRVRILSEKGKAAAELVPFLPEASSIEGRTVQPDGTQVVFDKSKDFLQKSVGTKGDERDVKVILPPGITANCVVELQWVEIAAGGQKYFFQMGNREVATGGDEHQIPYSLGHSALWRFGGPFKTRLLVIEFWRAFRWASYVDPGTCKEPELKKDGTQFTYTFKDVPAQERSPYSLEPLSGRPSVQVWTQPFYLADKARSKPADYWKEATYQYYRNSFWKDLKRGRAFDALAKELLEGLPADHAKAGETLLRRLDRRIVNQTWATHDEDAKFHKGETLDKVNPWDLDATASTGRTSALGMVFAYLALAEQAGLQPRIAMVTNRNHRLLRTDITDVYQLDRPLIGIPIDFTRTLWMDPGLRFAPPGLILPVYQGVQGLVMDLPAWEPRPEVIPALPPEFNRAVYRFRIDFAGTEEKISLQAGFTGFQELMERRDYLADAPEEADRNLKESMAAAIKDSTISRASVSNVLDPDKNVAWEVDAAREIPAAARFRVDPFPGMSEPFFLASTWPERRTVPIVMGYLRIHDAECVMAVPKGYKLLPTPDLRKENSFGKVIFTVTPAADGATAKVQFHVEVSRLSAPAAAEPELRQFVGWVEDGYHRELEFEKQ